MKKKEFFTEISDGIIDGDFYFQVSDYIFNVHNSNLRDAYYNPPSIESSESEGACIIYYLENENAILADINLQNFDWNNFQPELMSKINPKECKIERDKNDEFWTVSIPFKDMNNLPYESYKMELMFEKNKLTNIFFIENKIDTHYGGTMKSLQLIGELIKNINV